METPVNHSASAWSGIKARVVSGIIMACFFSIAVLVGGGFFAALVVLAALLMIREWDGLTEGQEPIWRHVGLFYVSVPCLSLLWLRNLETLMYPHAGMLLVLNLVFVVAATDIGAYFAGKQIGGPKLAPEISPSKTWAGLFGGMVAAGFVGLICHSFSPYPDTATGAISVAVMLAVVAQSGDLFESWLKRRAGVKDSGNLIPGHGGILDRMDGYVFAIPLFALLVFAADLP